MYYVGMSIIRPETIAETIINTLSTKSLNGKALLTAARTLKPGFTKQALYSELRKLVAQEVVIKHGTQYSLSKVWLDGMADFFQKAQERYGISRNNVDFLSLQDGDSISYTFKNPEESDRFLAHTFSVLSDAMHHDEPIYLYNPHEWYLLARTESEVPLFEDMKQQKRYLWLLAGRADPLDVYVKQYFDGEYLQYHMLRESIFEKNTYYVNIFSNFIMETHIDKATADKMDLFYKNTAVWDKNAERELKLIVSEGKTKVTISNNARKAAKLKKLMGEYFYTNN